MSPCEFIQAGRCERVKAAAHGVLLAGAVVCLGYNAYAWHRRREQHLLRNVAIYGALAALEVAQVRRHLRSQPCVIDLPPQPAIDTWYRPAPRGQWEG